jgi:hypothetical protein
MLPQVARFGPTHAEGNSALGVALFGRIDRFGRLAQLLRRCGPERPTGNQLRYACRQIKPDTYRYILVAQDIEGSISAVMTILNP